MPDIGPAALELLHELSNQFRRVPVAHVRGLSFQRVTDVDRNWHLNVFDHEKRRGFFPPVFVPKSLEVVEDGLRVAFPFLGREFGDDFPDFAKPRLNHLVPELSQFLCALVRGLKDLFDGLFFV